MAMKDDNDPLPRSGPPGPLQRLIKDQRVLFLLVGGANTAFSTALFAGLVLIYLFVPTVIVVPMSFSSASVLMRKRRCANSRLGQATLSTNMPLRMRSLAIFTSI